MIRQRHKLLNSFFLAFFSRALSLTSRGSLALLSAKGKSSSGRNIRAEFLGGYDLPARPVFILLYTNDPSDDLLFIDTWLP